MKTKEKIETIYLFMDGLIKLRSTVIEYKPSSLKIKLLDKIDDTIEEYTNIIEYIKKKYKKNHIKYQETKALMMWNQLKEDLYYFREFYNNP